MDVALLIVLVGELSMPLKPHLVQALPAASSERFEVVAEAPPGRDVVWVSTPSRDEVVLTLHIAREPGDLRRELRFSRSDPLPARGRAVAFAIAAMRAERKPSTPAVSDVATAPPTDEAPPARPPPAPPRWFLSARGLGALALPTVAGQGGGVFEAQYLFPAFVAVGLATSLSGGGVSNASWFQPAMWVSGSLRFDTGAWVPRASVGVGAVTSLITASKTTTTTWQPYFRVAVDVTWRVAKPHGLILGLAGHFTTAALPLSAPSNGNGNGQGKGNAASLGPAWVSLELGYAVEL